jgi:hypothetical protein
VDKKLINMDELLLKYNSLDFFLQRQVMEFVDYLLITRNMTKTTTLSDYKKKILNVSSWTLEETNQITENQKLFNKWNIQEF